MSTYLLINCAILFFPLALSFDKRVSFYQKWKYALPAILLPGIVFILWDIYFTKMGVWGFNQEHLNGIIINNLPLEEVLFFITVPYASLFIYETIKTYWPQINPLYMAKLISIFLILFLVSIAMVYFNHIYTSITFLGLAFTILILHFVFRSKIMGRFYIAYAIITVPFLLFNGLLTGSFLDSPVVWYNNNENLAFRIFTIPFEDIFYGMLLVFLNVSLFEIFRKKLREEL